MKNALKYWWLNQGGAAALALYSNGDRVIMSGIGTLDYPAFPDIDVLADGSQVMTYRKGADHNSTALDAIIAFRLETAGVWGSEITVASGAAPDNNLTDPAIGVTQTGRILVFYAKVSTSGSPSVRTSYFKYSDDNGANWSAEFLFSAEQDTGGVFEGKHLSPTGRAIQYDGYMLKPMYGTDTPGVGGRLGRLYKSVDDGETWTFVANIWPKSDDDGEEACLVALASGRLIASQRSDTVDETRLCYSDDAGLTWSAPVSIGFPSVSKSPLAVSPDGTLVIMGRWTGMGGVPIYSYTNDPTGIAGWSEQTLVSVRTSSFMYGGINWKTDRFHFVWAQGVLNESNPGVSGPNLIIEKEFIPSGTALVEPAVYSVEYQAALDYPQGQGVTIPTSAALKAAENQFVENLVSRALWDKADYIGVWRKHNAALGGYALYNLKKPSANIGAIIGTVTYGVNGYKPNGVDGAVDLNWSPSSGAFFTQNDAGLYIYINEDIEVAGTVTGVSSGNLTTQAKGPSLHPHFTDDNTYWKINDDTNTSAGAVSGIGGYFLQRRASDDKRLWKNGSQVATATTASVARTSQDLFVGATRFANGTGLFNATEVSVIIIGASFTGLEETLHDTVMEFITAVDAL